MAFPKHWRKGKPITAEKADDNDPGSFPHRVKIERRVSPVRRNEVKEEIVEWEDFEAPATMWARVEAQGGGETFQSQQVKAPLNHLVTISYRAGLTTEHRLNWGGRILGILSIANEDGVKDKLKIRCVEETGATPIRGY